VDGAGLGGEIVADYARHVIRRNFRDCVLGKVGFRGQINEFISRLREELTDLVDGYLAPPWWNHLTSREPST
jgi:hypothetical protein